MTVSRGLADGFADEIASCEHCRQKCLFQCKHIQGRVQLATNETYTRSSPDYVHTVLMWLTIAAPASDTVLMAVTGELGCVSVFAQRVVFTSLLFSYQGQLPF